MGCRISTAAVLLLIIGTQAAAQDRSRDVPSEGKPLLTEPAAMAKGFKFAEKYIKEDTGERKAGWYPVFKTNVTGDGWISLGSGYRVPFAGTARVVRHFGRLLVERLQDGPGHA